MKGAAFPRRARTVPVPDVFFARDLPRLADSVAVKVFLHCLWRIHRRPRGEPAGVRLSELVGDVTLRRGVTVLEPEGVWTDHVLRAVTSLVDAGLMLEHLTAEEAPRERWLFVNDAAGQRAWSKASGGEVELPRVAVPEAPAEDRRPVFSLYEDNIGVLTPLQAERLLEAEAAYPYAWIEQAIGIAVENNKRRWTYVRAILERWKREGRNDEADRGDRQEAGARYLRGPYSDFIET